MTAGHPQEADSPLAPRLQSPVSRTRKRPERARLTGEWLTFGLTAEQEDRFRQVSLRSDIARARVCVPLIFVPILGFAINDHKFFGLTSTFYGLLALRAALLGHALLFLRALRQEVSYRVYDRGELVWGLCLGACGGIIAATRPQAFVAHAIVAVGAAFLTLVAVPNRFTNQLAIAGIYTTGESLVIAPSVWTGAPAAVTALLCMWAANAVAIAVAWQLHSSRRQEFLAREEEQRAEEDWARTFDSVPDLIALLDDQHRLTRVNRAMAERLGRQPTECVGLRCYEAVHGLDAPPPFCPNTKTLHDGQQHTVDLHEDRLQGDFIVSTTLLASLDGRPTGTVHVAREITERKRAEEERQRGATLLETVFSAMADGVVVCDTDGTVVRTNATARSVFGMDPVGEQVTDVARRLSLRGLDGRSLRRGEVSTCRALRGERVTGEHFVLTNAEGLEVVVESSATALRDGAEITGAVMTWHDITDLVRAQEALQEADRRKNEFLAVLSHELRNPLAPIRNSLHVLDQVAPGSDLAQRAQQVIDRQTSQLARLVDDLLDVTRISRNKLQLQLSPVDLNDLVRLAVDDHHLLFEQKGIRIETNLTGARLPIQGDAVRLTQAVGNLLLNAAKFTPGGGQVTVSTAVAMSAGRAVLQVVDNGSGIEPATLLRLFEPFTQADRTLDRSSGGLGLGLALVKALVELHGGVVAAHSDGPGRGSEFVVELPLGGAPATVAAAPPAATLFGHLRVLVIEDNVDAANSLRDVLKLNQHHVEVAHDGLAGLAKAREFKPDVVLCDIGLPGMSGFEVARAFRADESLGKTLLVALSGYALPEDRQQAAEAGFHHHLAKPPSLKKLGDLLARVHDGGLATRS
jgi:PAS domain S-box-containing protein